MSASQQAVLKYSVAARAFHWIGALLLLATYALISIGEGNIGLHKAMGVSFLIWTLLRIANRMIGKSPAPVAMPAWQTLVSKLTHLALYVAMIVMPLSGLMMSMYAGRATSVFGLFEVPVLVTPSREMAGLLNEFHGDVIWTVLWVLIVAHVVAALYHQFVVKDNLLSRMR